MALIVRPAGASEPQVFGRGAVVRIGRGPGNDVRVGDYQVEGAWTVSTHHVEIRWEAGRWTTANVSSRPGLLHVYEPGWEDVVLQPGRSWAAARHRWSYGLGRPGHLFQVVCSTDDHHDATVPEGSSSRGGNGADGRGGAGAVGGAGAGAVGGAGAHADADSTAMLPAVPGPLFTPLEQAVLLAYYGDFARLPRPAILEPASHHQAARRLRRSTDSARKAIERINDKIARGQDPPPAATGRQLSAEIGRWLARAGALDAIGCPPYEGEPLSCSDIDRIL